MYKYNPRTRFRVKRPIRSFRDLEVYQKSLEGAVMIAKHMIPVLKKLDYPLGDEMIHCSLEIPRTIAEAHSRRFDSNIEGIVLLEKAMSDSNKMIVYLEQIRDIYPEKIEKILCEELIRKYIRNRRKILNLSKAWKKWLEEDKK